MTPLEREARATAPRLHFGGRLVRDCLLAVAWGNGRLRRTETALRFYAKVLQRWPDDLLTLEEHAQLAQQAGQLDLALADRSQRVALQPDSPDAYQVRAELYRRLGRGAEADADLERALALLLIVPNTEFRQAALLVELRRYEDAMARFSAIVRDNSADLAARLGRGLALWHLHRYSEALLDLDACRVVTATEGVALRFCADCHLKLHHWRAAYSDLTATLAHHPRDPVLFTGRALALLALEQYEEALADCYVSLELRPQHSVTLVIRARACLALKHFTEAIDDFTQALAARPDDAETLAYRGTAFLAVNRPREAMADFEQRLAQSPQPWRALVGRADLHRAWGQYEDALADYSAALTQKPRGTHGQGVRASRGWVYARLERHMDALADYGVALDPDPLDPAPLYNNRAVSLTVLGRFEEALADYRAALQHNLDDPGTRANRALTYHKMGRTPDASDEFARLSLAFPRNADVLYPAAAWAALCGESETALADLATAIICDPAKAGQARQDPDFVSIREHPAFRALIASGKAAVPAITLLEETYTFDPLETEADAV